MIATDDKVVEKVGGYEFTVRFADAETPESRLRWERRAGVLAAWLIEQWDREQQGFRNN